MTTTNNTLITIETSGKWDGGLKNSVFIRDFSPIIVDEPKGLGGTDEGPNPIEYVLGALSTCTSITIAFVAKELKFSYSGLEFENSGTLDLRGINGVDGVRTHFQTVDIEILFDTDESIEKIERLKETVEKRCPVFNLLKDAGVQLNANWVKK